MTDWSKFLNDPTAPAGQKDWRNSPWGDVTKSAAQQFLPSAGRDISSGIQSGVSLAKRVLSAPPVSHDQLAAELKANPHPAQKLGSQVSAVPGAIGDYVHNKYLAPGALKQTLATDPFGVASDIGTVAAPIEGGAGLLARAPGIVGDVGAGINTAAKLANPIALAGNGTGAGARAIQTVVRGGSALDKTGALTPAAVTALHTAFPNGELTPAELANPKFRAQVAQTFSAKGITPAAAKEAVLTYNGAPTARSVVSGTRSPAQSVTTDTVSGSKAAIGAKAQAIAGAQAPDPTSLGAAVHDADSASMANAVSKYDALRAQPGSFGTAMDGKALNADIGDELEKANFIQSPALFNAQSYPQATAAKDLINNVLVNGDGTQLTAPVIAEVRRQLTTLQNAADGPDQAATGAVIAGFHNNLEKAADNGLFTVPTAAGTMASNYNVSGALKDANAAYAQHFNTFGNSHGPAGAIKRAVSSLKGSAAAGIDDGSDAQIAAGGNLATNLLSPTNGPATHSLLINAMGGPGTPGADAVNDYVRQSVLKTDNAGNLVMKPAQIRTFLNGPVGQKIFSPDEQSDIRLMAAGNDVLNTKTPLPAPNNGGAMRAGIAGLATGAAANLMGAHLGFPGVAEVGAGMIGSATEHTLENLNNARRAANEANGAPAVGDFLNVPKAAGDTVAAAAPAIAATGSTGSADNQSPLPVQGQPVTDPDVVQPTSGPVDWSKYLTDPIAAPQADGGRIERASGGRTDNLEHLVQKLIELTHRAKKEESRQTKPLLHVPDNTIVRALDIAQKAI